MPLSYPRASYLAHRQAIDAAIARVLERGTYILGDEVARFESEFAAWLGATACAGVASGTDAVELALRGCGIGAGATVIAPSFTSVAAIAAIVRAGATPYLVDIENATMTIDVEQTRAALEAGTKGGRTAVLAVHLFGCPADVVALRALTTTHGAVLIEDCAQAHGAEVDGRRVGTWGDAAAFSFYPTKNLGALGDGGAVVSMDQAVVDRVRLLRQYGWVRRNVSEVPGMNSRLDELQAAVLRVKLPFVDGENVRRRELAAAYEAALSGLPLRLPVGPPDSTHVFHQYVVRTPQRDGLRKALAANDITTVVHYPVPAHEQPAYRGRIPGASSFAQSAAAATQVVSLPMNPHMTVEHVQRIGALVREHVIPAATL